MAEKDVNEWMDAGILGQVQRSSEDPRGENDQKFYDHIVTYHTALESSSSTMPGTKD